MTTEATESARLRKELALRRTILSIYYGSLTIAWISLLYLLFMFGHTDTAPLPRVLTVAAIGATCALVGGILRWAGLPKVPEKKDYQ